MIEWVSKGHWSFWRAGLACTLSALAFDGFAATVDIPPPPPGLPPLTTAQGPLAPPKTGFRLQFDRISIVDLLAICYSDVLQRSYALDAAIASRTDTVSVNFSSKKPEAVFPVLEALIEGVGGEIVRKGGIDIIRPVKTDKTSWETFVYKPKARSVQYLISSMGSQFTGAFSAQGASSTGTVQKAGAGADKGAPLEVTSTPLSGADVLVFYGPKKDVKTITELLPKLDTAEDDLVITASVYEVSGLGDKETALGLVLNLAKKNVSLGGSIGAQASAGKDSVTLGYGGIGIIAQFADTDSRFKLVSTPVLRAKSGQSENVTLGDSVSIITGAVLDKNGNPVVNRELKQSGLSFTAKPTARDERVEVEVTLSFSDATGTQDNPRFLNRSWSGVYGAAYGEAVTIGGLRQEKSQKGSTRFFGFQTGSAENMTHTEFLVVITTDKAKL